ncbi:MAG TPA: hypothetical protein VK559_00305 [Ferruginibacter sp.]|nr:hypothetical protein [Ferruginibacter sp.]
MMKKKIGAILEKLGLKKVAVSVDLYVHAKCRETIKSIRVAIIPYIVKARSSRGYYAIDFDSDWNGFGSRIVKTLEILLYCEMNNLIPLIRYNYQEKKAPTTDYFKELFYYKNPLPIDETKISYTKIRDNDELWKENYNQKLQLSSAKSLFDKYLGINPDITTEVESFKQQWFGNKKILGVHYRGTDKIGEALLVPKESLFKYINQVIAENTDLKLIFLSTDDKEIINYLKRSPLPLPLIYRDDSVRSGDGEQFHRKEDVSKSLINKDAIVNCLLLSNCHILLKTASILSDCSVVFNPGINVKVMSIPHNKDLTWWPATEINKYSILQPIDQ